MVEQEERKIPYIGVARVGNFKLWKARVRERKSDVLHISDMDGTWGVKIPQTYLSFTMIEEAYKEGNDEFLKTCLANMNFVTAITNGFYQQGVAMVGHAYLKPELLREDYKPETGPGHADLLDEAKKVCEGFLKWYEDVQAMQKEQAAQTGDILAGDDAADAAAKLLGEEEKENDAG